MTSKFFGAAALVLTLVGGAAAAATPTGQAAQPQDAKVRAFLDGHAGQWRDMNVSEADGKILYDLIIKNKYTRALEIGTSTGHSGIWIAWALSKTGGKLITVDIDEGRYREALANFREAGLDAFIDARLADAHELVPALAGPFDFVFCDADKDCTRIISSPSCPSSSLAAVSRPTTSPPDSGVVAGGAAISSSTSSVCRSWRRPSPREAGRGCRSATSAQRSDPAGASEACRC